MPVLTGNPTALRIWRFAPSTPVGVALTILDDATGLPLTSAALVALSGKLAVLAAGTDPTGPTDPAFVDFTWVKWADDFGEAIDVASIVVGPDGAVDWPADVTSVAVWWLVSDVAKTMGGIAPGSVELYG